MYCNAHTELHKTAQCLSKLCPSTWIFTPFLLCISTQKPINADGNQRFIFEDVAIPSDTSEDVEPRRAQRGEYVRVRVDEAGVTNLKGPALARTTLTQFGTNFSQPKFG